MTINKDEAINTLRKIEDGILCHEEEKRVAGEVADWLAATSHIAPDAAQPPGTSACAMCDGTGVIHQCIICGSAEPRTGTCGSDDPRALCNFVAPDAAATNMQMSREEKMVVIKRNHAGVPTVWCDPEIANLVAVLNGAGISTIASCSGHGGRFGNIALVDGRELLILPNYEAARAAEKAILAAPAPMQASEAAGAWTVGSLLTLSDYDYPGMGSVFGQVWQGDTLIARVYGDNADEVRERTARISSPAIAPEAATACSHVWNDFGQLGGRNVVWCPRCDVLAWTGKEPSPAIAPEASELPPIKTWQERAASLGHDISARRFTLNGYEATFKGDEIADLRAAIANYIKKA